ncbi:MAG: penicillin-binding protein 1A [Alphaproteobacteria bacterium]|nr:penicillin-binding protein 1A [Alphaproteobacteria bacterium]
MRYLFRFFVAIVLIAMMAVGGMFMLLHRYGRNLPDHAQLAAYEPPVVTRVHAADGRLLAEFAIEERVFVPIGAIPRRVIDAILAAEDKNFYRHTGIDVIGIARAAVTNLLNAGQNRRLQGASTITQQVAKNFLLTNEVSIDRKIKEALLALRIEKALPKERILELYLNEIYLGQGAYGVAAAALAYFNKSLDELTTAEAAYLAALPKAPNNYHPVRNAQAAIDRRNWVLDRMVEDRVLTATEAAISKAEPLVQIDRDPAEVVSADYVAEEIRRELIERFGEKGTYEGGLSVHATLDPRLQEIAERAFRAGLIDYDRRHGWRGPIARIEPGAGSAERLAAVPLPPGLGDWRLALVTDVAPQAATIGFADGRSGTIPLVELEWARATLAEQKRGPAVDAAGDALAVGDVVAVSPADGETAAEDVYGLRQIPDVEGAFVALDPRNGRILAMVGGFAFGESEFNRAVQARRQPGSAFKPFVYLAALDAGKTPSSIVDDAPIVIDPGFGQPLWKPENYSQEYYGPSTLRLGIEKSRNLMTVRLAAEIGMQRVRDTAIRFGVLDEMGLYLPMALGAGETTLLRMTNAYAMIVNGGKRIAPTLIERVQDRYGRTLYRRDERVCDGCRDVAWEGQPVPQLPDLREQIADPGTVFQMVAMLQGVVERGTGVSIAELGRPLAGKTGTTDEFRDAWFVGFSPDLAAGVYVGFDQPRTLGNKEAGAKAAVPIFKQFMAEALAGEPPVPFRIPPGIRLVRVDAETGRLPSSGSKHVIIEAFKPGTEPTSAMPEPAAGATSTQSIGSVY